MTRAAWFLGAEVHTALGRGLEATRQALGAAPPAPALAEVPLGAEVEKVPSLLLAGLPLGDTENRLWNAIEPVVEAAISASGLTADQLGRAALMLGTSSLDISVSEAVYARDLKAGLETYPLLVNASMGAVGERLRRRFGLRGPDYTINTACTSSANALIYADAMIRDGIIDHAVIVGLEIFNVITALGFQSLGLLSSRGMRPFDPDRSGLVLGEACAAMVVGPAPGPSGFRLKGGANLCDTHGVSAANPDGSTVEAVMRQALEAAGVARESVLAAKAHGTASLLNDEAEAAGVLRLFDSPPPLTALKPFIGHTFGACGLAELILFCTAVEAGFVPGVLGVAAEPSELGLTLIQQPMPVGRGDFLLNYFGFGGNNTSLVVSNG